MIQKNKFLTILIFGLIIVANNANSEPIDDFKFYVGAGFGYSKYGINRSNIPSNNYVRSKGVGLLLATVGIKFHYNFAIETGYSFNRKIVWEPEKTYKVRNTYIDLIKFIPIIEQINFFAGAGVGRFILQKGNNVDDVYIKNKFNWRVKGGAQYAFNDDFALNALFTYQKVSNKIDNVEFVKNMKSINLIAVYIL